MTKFFTVVLSIVFYLIGAEAFSIDLKQGHLLFEAGIYNSTQGQNQDVLINGLLGDRFNVSDRHDSNAVFGLGYLIDGMQRDRFNLDYGLNVFYLANTAVKGTIDQEFAFTNLAYSYEVSHLPVYAMAKATVKTNSERFAVTLDAGIGPNFLDTSHYRDWSLDGMTLPDYAFSGRSEVTFSAMAGIGLKLMNLPGQAPLECGYRFFYLGEGSFNRQTNQLLTSLNTGTNYAQALLCTVTV